MTYATDGTIKLYEDGSLIETWSGDPLTVSADTSRIYIGKSNENESSNLFRGKIEEIKIYDKELSSAEISAKFSSGPTTD